MTSSTPGTTEPSADETRTWHTHDDGSWDWGVSCVQCESHPTIQLGPKVNFNIHHLKQQNREGWTVREKQREIEDGAKADGREIERR